MMLLALVIQYNLTSVHGSFIIAFYILCLDFYTLKMSLFETFWCRIIHLVSRVYFSWMSEMIFLLVGQVLFIFFFLA